jgi:hypothetical protein
MVFTCMPYFNIWTSIYFAKKILQGLNSCNFIQCNNEQIYIWSSPLCRVVQGYSYKIYFLIFGHSYKFLRILEASTIFWELNQLKNNLNRLHSAGPQSGPRPAACGRNQPACGGTATCCTRAKLAQPGCADGPRRQCHALSVVTARRTCPGWRGGASAEGSPAARLPRGQGWGHGAVGGVRRCNTLIFIRI